MNRRNLLGLVTTLTLVTSLYADVAPYRDKYAPFRLDRPLPPPTKVTLRIVRDGNVTTGRLTLPQEASTKRADAQPAGPTSGGVMIGLALTAGLVAGGLWLARLPRAKYLTCAVIPLLGLALIDGLNAQPVRLDAPRPVVERTKVTIARGEAGQVHLVLPRK